jgi:perosamine synthetase
MTTAKTAELPVIAGGEPAKKTPFRKEKRYGEEELKELREALEQGTLFYAQGKKVKQLESEFAKSLDMPYAVACSSGTAAVHTAMIAAGISPGDEVILTPITDMGSVIPILLQGAVPVFADVDPDTANSCPASVAAAVTPKTRAVLAVHLAGIPCDMDALTDLCRKKNLVLIEDCAQAFGCLYDGRPVGTFGAIGCFSFNEFKHISCGDGGIVVTRDSDIARRLRLSTDKGYNREPGVDARNPTFLAANYRMTELQGAVALAQLPKLAGIVERRQKWAKGLTAGISGIPGLRLPRTPEKGVSSAWFYLMRVSREEFKADADEFAAALQAEGLPASAHYIGRCVYEYPLFLNHSAYAHAPHPFAARDYAPGLCPAAEKLLSEAVLIHINEAYSEDDLKETVHGVRKVSEYFASR